MSEEQTKSLIPQISQEQLPKVIEEGKEVVRPDVLQTVTQLAQLGQMVKIRKSLEKEEFWGEIDTRTLEVTDEVKYINLIDDYPNYPWISAYFINDGPSTVYIGINMPWEWIEIENGETRAIDHAHAIRKIRVVFYKCNAGKTASVRVEAHY